MTFFHVVTVSIVGTYGRDCRGCDFFHSFVSKKRTHQGDGLSELTEMIKKKITYRELCNYSISYVMSLVFVRGEIQPRLPAEEAEF